MSKNPILDEIHVAREKLYDEADRDLDKLVAGIRDRQVKSGHRLVSGEVCKTSDPHEVPRVEIKS